MANAYDIDPDIDCTETVQGPARIEALRKRLSSYSSQLGRMAGHFSLLGGETRLKILTLLDNAGELCVCDMAAILGMSPAAVSQHLSRLRSGGLVASRRDGMTIYYRRTPTSIDSCPKFPQFRPLESPQETPPASPQEAPPASPQEAPPASPQEAPPASPQEMFEVSS